MPDAPEYTYSPATLPITPPAIGELMWYYKDDSEAPSSAQKAGKADVRGAIWLAQLKFSQAKEK